MVPKNAEASDARGMCLYAQMLENGLGVKKKRGARAGMVRQGRGGRIQAQRMIRKNGVDSGQKRIKI